MLVRELLLPVFVQVGLTFALLFMMGRARVGAIRRGKVRIGDIALGQPAWPDPVTKIGNAFANQFQLPLLFYVLAGLAIVTRQADLVITVLAWLFVATRLVHSVVHVTSNHVPTRFNAYVAGFVILLAMWVYFAVRIMLGEG
ncbi:MAG: MAPEG family protein [Hyphomicrobiaceae bacterium]|nr:MAPEG family protein [Hyphomicrobiaceae bacterium]